MKNVCSHAHHVHVMIVVYMYYSMRLSNSVLMQVLMTHGCAQGFNEDTVVVIAGLSNTYCGYTTTFEEYQVYKQPVF